MNGDTQNSRCITPIFHGFGLDKRLLRSHYLKRSRKGGKFPPRAVGLWCEEGIRRPIRSVLCGDIFRMMIALLAIQLPWEV